LRAVLGPQETAKHAIALMILIKLQRVSEPQISPDGKWVAYTTAVPDMRRNRNASNIWLVATSGGEAIQLTQSGKDSSPVWSPDGKTIAFVSGRSGDSQVYLLSMEGGEPHPLTKLSTGGSSEVVSGRKDDLRSHPACIRNARMTSATKRRMRKRKKQGEGACSGGAALPALDALE